MDLGVSVYVSVNVKNEPKKFFNGPISQEFKDQEDIVAGHSKVTFQRHYNENAQISAQNCIQAIDKLTSR